MSQIEKDCATSTGMRCDVVTFYSGEVYNLYEYKKYTDVRLVFAPEFDAAFFGGDPDNFTYPRYDLDITFFRVYENDKPAHIEHYLRWSKSGVKDNELIFVAGNSMAMAMRERTTEVAVLKAIGFSKGLVLFLVLAESVLVAGVGGAIGALGCKACFDIVDISVYTAGFLPFFSIPWSVTLIGLGASLVIGFISGFFPAILAANAIPVPISMPHAFIRSPRASPSSYIAVAQPLFAIPSSSSPYSVITIYHRNQ